MPSYEHELMVAREVASAAGEVLIQHFGSGLSVTMKGWADPVTVADRESEALIRSTLRAHFPDDGTEGEEEGTHQGTSGRLWLIDPLDGTADFAGGLPIFAVVLTLVLSRDPSQALLNVTYDPIRREMFHGILGRGAYLNDRPLQVSTNADLTQALVHLHFSNRRAVWQTSLELARRIITVSPHARNLGSSALAQAYVAAGRLDAHTKVTCGRYDVVGGNLLITEAGGIISDLDGHPWQMDRTLLATSAAIHGQLLSITANLGLEF